MPATPTPPRPARLLDCAQVAERIGCHPNHVRRLARQGRIPFGLKLGRSRRWRESEVSAWIEAGCPPCGK